MGEVVVVIGAGSIGQAIARRISAGKHVLLADLRQEHADAAGEVLSDAGSRQAPRQWMCPSASRFSRWWRRLPAWAS
jgi:NAD(P)-dependent dehydrogenase (short-subunit alcohol dehydrogenase family)